MIRRYIEETVREDLKKKMVFVAGPRQVGKTFLAKYMLPDEQGYLNWDIPLHRDRILKREYPPVSMLVFDEIHKYRDWRNYLKGFYDQFENKIETLVTGSARLEYYRFGGDSLQGRYHMHRLFPFTYGELDSKRKKDLFDLFTLGGFPEPFLSGSETTARRWTREYRDLLVHEEIISLENVQDTGSMQLCAIRLAELTSSPLSINALREDLQVSHKTVSRWLEIFSRLYMIFRISPFGSTKIRAVKKEQKHYFFDWNVIEEKGSRFENIIMDP
jgi:hypothetical protein